MDREIFQESRRLKEIIESCGWALFEANGPGEDPFTWEGLQEKGPAKEYEIEKNYVFAPIPQPGQSLRDAYAVTKGLGPSLTITDPDEERWLTLYVTNWSNKRGKPIFFSRLFFHKEGVAAMTPKSSYTPDPDMLGIKYPYLIDTFEKYFRIVLPEERGIQTPIPMPRMPRAS